MSDMSAFRTTPQSEFKAAEEMQQAGFSAFVPTEYRYRRSGASRTRRTKIRVPMCPGYVFGSGKPSEARHVRNRIGSLKSEETKHLQDISGKEIDNEPAAVAWATGEAALVTVLDQTAEILINHISRRGSVTFTVTNGPGGLLLTGRTGSCSITQLLKKPPDQI